MLKGIYRLVFISYYDERVVSQQIHELLLGSVEILIFVDKNVIKPCTIR